MSAHCTVEVLSTYLDEQLDESQGLAVEAHVRECVECRRRLSALRGVVGDLKRLEQVEAPPTLGWQVQRQVRIEAGKRSLARKLEDRIGQLMRQPLVAPLFAVVVAFGAILYLFSFGVARQTASGTRMVIGAAPAGTTAEADLPVAAVGKRSEVQATVGTEDSLLAGRRFEIVDGIWMERGIADRGVGDRIVAQEVSDLPAALAEMFGHPGTYRLWWEGRVLELVIPGASG